MKAFMQVFSVLAVSSCYLALPTSEEYEADIIFYGFNSKDPTQRFISNLTSDISQQCDMNGEFSIIAHGWMEGIVTPWIPITVKNLLRYRGGCVFVIDYSKYANVSNYFALTPHFDGISEVFLKKVKEIGNYDRQYCFGFSFGSRLCIDAGLKLGNQVLGRMDLCDPAVYGFDIYVDPKPAAKNVGCINTSTDKGTYVYNCHQNFRMGYCGSAQLASSSYPVGSHGLCPYFYNLAFSYDFINNNYYGCSSSRLMPSPPKEVKMGYLGEFNRTYYRGDIFIATGRQPPYVFTGDIENQFASLLSFFDRCNA